ncbi:MAG: phosphate acyltransferase PlsX [Clostridia bacterium]|nr:phosphate acyltransferase PlsX [Clostridia bacterium]
MKIIVDAFGGDHAPVEILKGCAMAVAASDVEILLSGEEDKIRAAAEENGVSLDRMTILPANGVIEMSDHPNAILKEKKDCSMAVGLRALHDGAGDAFVTAGSTGAALIGATFLVKRIRGIKRAALATLLPADGNGHVLMLDCGANADCRPEMLLQFGIMGSKYMTGQLGIENPRVGLLNIGTEETKGGELQLAAFELLKSSDLNFIGNVEARDMLTGVCDVLVCDGFNGNIFLKTCEGTVALVMRNLKGIFLQNLLTKLAAAVVKKGLKAFKKKMDYTEVGGAPLIGVTKPVIKAHGSSNALAIKNAVLQANRFAEAHVVETIAAAVSGETVNDD